MARGPVLKPKPTIKGPRAIAAAAIAPRAIAARPLGSTGS